jgi:hypothetical protein
VGAVFREGRGAGVLKGTGASWKIIAPSPGSPIMRAGVGESSRQRLRHEEPYQAPVPAGRTLDGPKG